MKSFKILFTFAFVLCFGMSYGQLTVDASNNVGVGTAAPATEFDAIGTVKISSVENDASGITIRNASAKNANITKTAEDGQGNVQIDINPIPLTDGANAKFRFFRATNTTGLVAFDVHVGNNTSQVNCQLSGNNKTILNRFFGNVGVGLSNPTEKLEVAGNIKADNVMFQDPNSPERHISIGDVVNELNNAMSELRNEVNQLRAENEALKASLNQ